MTDSSALEAKMLQVQQECVRTLRANGIKIPANELPRPPEHSRKIDDAVKAQNELSAIVGSSKAAHYADRAAKTRFRKGAVKLRGNSGDWARAILGNEEFNGKIGRRDKQQACMRHINAARLGFASKAFNAARPWGWGRAW